MQFGRHLRELWELRAGFVASIAVAAIAALWSVGSISLFPPGIKARPLEMAAASTQALVDTPKSSVLDLGMTTYDMQAVTNRSLLIGNIMASPPVRGYIARRAHVPADRIRVASPVTPDFPRQLAISGKPHTKDILRSPDEYRLSIQSNPTVPIVDVFAQAPTAVAAQNLANGAVAGMTDYLRDLARAQAIRPAEQVHLEQLGPAKGGVLNRGVGIKLAALTFLLAFCACSATTLLVARVRRGWVDERDRDRAPAASGVTG